MKLDRSFIVGLFSGLFFSLMLISISLGVTIFILAKNHAQFKEPTTVVKPRDPDVVPMEAQKEKIPQILDLGNLNGFPSVGLSTVITGGVESIVMLIKVEFLLLPARSNACRIMIWYPSLN